MAGLIAERCRNRVKIRNYNMPEICVLMHADVGNTQRVYREGNLLWVESAAARISTWEWSISTGSRDFSFWSTRQTDVAWQLWVQSKLEWSSLYLPYIIYILSYFIFGIETTKETELISWQINKQNPKNKDNKETKQKTPLKTSLS